MEQSAWCIIENKVVSLVQYKNTTVSLGAVWTNATINLDTVWTNATVGQGTVWANATVSLVQYEQMQQ